MPVATLAPIPPRLAEIQARFTPSAVRSSTSGTSSTGSINTSTFSSVLSSMLGAASADTDGSTSIDLSTLTDLMSSVATSRQSALGATALSTASTTAGPSGGDAVAAAKQYLGVDYVWGGTDPKKGLDCSGLVQRAYRDIGIELPRVSYDQAKVGTKVDSIDQAKPGDLVAFGSPVDHIAIYVGDGKIIQAPRTGDVVRITDIRRPIAAIRRVIPTAQPRPVPSRAQPARPASPGPNRTSSSSSRQAPATASTPASSRRSPRPSRTSTPPLAVESAPSA